MSSRVPPHPFNAQMLDAQGFLTPIWSDWFRAVFQRIGGNVSYTNDELYEVDAVRIGSDVAGNGLTGGGGTALAVNPDGSSLEISSDQVRVKDSGISTAKVANDAVSFVKLLSTDWTKSNAASGYQKLPSGLFIQWGVTTSLNSATTTTISFPTSFPTNCRQVIAGIQGNSAGSTTATGQWGTGNYTTTGFDLYNRTSAAYTFNYLAVGY